MNYSKTVEQTKNIPARSQDREHKDKAKIDDKLYGDAEILDRYLSQYRIYINRKNSLVRRKEEIRKEFSPYKSPKYDGMPHGQPSGDTIAYNYVAQLEEIDNRISEQIAKIGKVLKDISDVIDLLPEKSPEDILSKAIIENRYIDRFTWEKIYADNAVSNATAWRYWKRGLNILLANKKVNRILKEFSSEGKNEQIG